MVIPQAISPPSSMPSQQPPSFVQHGISHATGDEKTGKTFAPSISAIIKMEVVRFSMVFSSIPNLTQCFQVTRVFLFQSLKELAETNKTKVSKESKAGQATRRFENI